MGFGAPRPGPTATIASGFEHQRYQREEGRESHTGMEAQ